MFDMADGTGKFRIVRSLCKQADYDPRDGCVRELWGLARPSPRTPAAPSGCSTRWTLPGDSCPRVALRKACR